MASDEASVNDFSQVWKDLTSKAAYLPTLLNIEYDQKNELSIDGLEYM